jgi:hypothetical protein
VLHDKAMILGPSYNRLCNLDSGIQDIGNLEVGRSRDSECADSEILLVNFFIE